MEGGLAAVLRNEQAMRELVGVISVDAKACRTPAPSHFSYTVPLFLSWLMPQMHCCTGGGICSSYFCAQCAIL